MYSVLSVGAVASFIFASSCSADSIYGRNSAVLQVNGKNFDEKIKNTYNASVVEFYAPWCGHCQNLKPAYEKAAKNLEGIAQVAAVNCDEDENKEFCGRMGVKGFPTLKTVRQTGTFGKPIISDYNGGRTANDIVEAVKNLLPNHVTRLQDKEWDSWLAKNNESAKAILFSDKGTTSALIKSLANDFYESISIAQVRDKEKDINAVFGVTKYPTLVVLPGGDKEAVVYDGDLKRPGMLAFLGQYGKVRIVPSKGSKKTKSSSKADKKASSAFSKASSSHKSAEASSSVATASTVTIDEPGFTESPDPKVEPEATPIPIPETPEPIAAVQTQEELSSKCFGPKTNTCLLAIISAAESGDSTTALSSLASLTQKHSKRGDRFFPFYAIPASNPAAQAIKKALKLEDSEQPQLIAVNGKRKWWRQHNASQGFELATIESWIEGIRLGDSKKNKLPADLIVEPKETSSAASEEPTLAHGEL